MSSLILKIEIHVSPLLFIPPLSPYSKPLAQVTPSPGDTTASRADFSVPNIDPFATGMFSA